MLNRLSKSRKKIKDSKPNQSKNQKSKGKLKQIGKKLPPKPHHQHSTNSLFKNHNLSQCSLISQQKKTTKKKTKNNQSSVSLIAKLPNQKEIKKPSKQKRNSIVGKKSKEKLSPGKVNNKFSKKKDEVYEIVNVQMCKSKTHSEINFSNDSSVRANRMEEKENIKARKNLTIQCSDEYILNQYFSNSRIKNLNRIKVQSAIKIQKVFRGYLTRKIFQQYIERLEAKTRDFQKFRQEMKKLESPNREKSKRHSKEIQELEDFSITKMEEKQAEDQRKEQKPQEDSDIFRESSIDIDDIEINRPITSIKHVVPSEIDQQSSIYPQQNESISKYLHEELEPSNIKEESHNSKEQVEEQQRPYFKNEQKQKYISFEEMKDKLNSSKNDSKNTPKLSPELSKNQEPMPTDFSEKKLSQFHSMEYLARSKKSQNFPSHQKQEERSVDQTKTKNMIKKIKKEEKEKWGVVISMLNQQITQTTHKNTDMMNFMKAVLNFSKKNKEELQTSFLNISQNNQGQESSFKKKISPKSLSKKKNLSIQIDISPMKIQLQNQELTNLMQKEAKQRKNEDLPLLIKKTPKEPKSLSSLFEKTENLKKYLSNNMYDYPIEEMVQIREKALEKKQKIEVDKLNVALFNEIVTEDEFIVNLQDIQNKFEAEKQLIKQAKYEILKGYKATHKLIQDSFIDAKILGFNIPFSRSLDQIKGQNNWINEIIVDEIKSLKSKGSENSESGLKKKPLNISLQDSSLYSEKIHNQSSSLMIGEECSYNEGDLENNNLESHPSYIFEVDQESSQNEEDIGEFKKVQKYSSDLQKKYCQQLLYSDQHEKNQKQKTLENIIILNRRKAKQEQKSEQKAEKYKNFSSGFPKSEVYKIDVDDSSSEDEQMIFNEEDVDPKINEIVESQIVKLIWQATADLYENSRLRVNFSQRKNQRIPKKITYDERTSFVECLMEQIPEFELLKSRLNQKMVPNRIELLKHMRVSFDDDEDDEQLLVEEEFQEIGKYQMILCEKTRMKVIEKYMSMETVIGERIVTNEQISSVLEDKISPSCIRKVIERERILTENSKQRHELRNQIKKIQLHCIFDAINEIIIKLRLKKGGYTGIGLNELSFILGKQGIKQIQDNEQFNEIKKQTQNCVKEILGEEKTLKEKLFMENYEEFYLSDSQWVLYSDEALSFALELGFLIEDEIFCEVTDEMNLITHKNRH